MMQAIRSSHVDIKEQLVEHERNVDVHLDRITQLQKLLDLEEARLLRIQEQRRTLESMLQAQNTN
jgi:hypothetical protein